MKFLIYCRELQFEERPDYNYLINLLEEILEYEDFRNDYVYDWDVKEIQDRNINNIDNLKNNYTGKEIMGSFNKKENSCSNNNNSNKLNSILNENRKSSFNEQNEIRSDLQKKGN